MKGGLVLSISGLVLFIQGMNRIHSGNESDSIELAIERKVEWIEFNRLAIERKAEWIGFNRLAVERQAEWIELLRI